VDVIPIIVGVHGSLLTFGFEGRALEDLAATQERSSASTPAFE
jgi:hypothetical protein